MSHLVDVVGEFLRRVRAQRTAQVTDVSAPDVGGLLREMEGAWEEARKEQEALPALAEAACRDAIRLGKASDAMTFYALLTQMRTSTSPEVTNG